MRERENERTNEDVGLEVNPDLVFKIQFVEIDISEPYIPASRLLLLQGLESFDKVSIVSDDSADGPPAHVSPVVALEE
jgi:hypothetical protein